MKKGSIIALLLILVMVITISMPVFGQADSKEKVKLTESQKKILRAHGLTDEEIVKIDIEGIRNVLRRGRVVNPSEFSELKPVYGNNRPTDEQIKIFKENGLTENKLRALRQMGYDFCEIEKLDSKTLYDIFGDMTITSYNPPNGYQYVAEVPDGGGTDEWFHPNADIDDLQWWVNASRATAMHVFNESNYSILRYSYYLYGEFDEAYNRTHEGVDMRHTTVSNRDIRSFTPGRVINVNNSWGAVQIYDSYLDETITYMHLTNVLVSSGSTVAVGQVIGKQGTTGLNGGAIPHLHIQAYDGESTSMPSSNDNTLYCRIPYGFMTWYI